MQIKEENHLIKAQEEIREFVEESKCGLCNQKAENITKALGDLVKLYQKARDFVEFADNSIYLRMLNVDAESGEDETIE